MAEIDRLDVKISAEAKSAEEGLDKLIGKLGGLSEQLAGIKTGNLKSLAGEFKTLSSEISKTTIKPLSVNLAVNKGATKQVDGLGQYVEKTAKEMAANLQNAFGIPANKMSGIKVATEEYAKALQMDDKETATGILNGKLAQELLKTAASAQEAEGSMKDFYNTVKAAGKIYINPIDMPTDGWKDLDGLLRQKFTSQKGADAIPLNSIMEEWTGKYGYLFSGMDVESSANQVEALTEVVKRCREEIERPIVTQGTEFEEAVWERLISEADKAYKGITTVKDSMAKLGISDTEKTSADEMKALSDYMAELDEKYADLGKNFEFSGSLEAMRNKLASLKNTLSEANGEKEKLEAQGKFYTKGYDEAIAKVYKYSNSIDVLQEKINALTGEVNLESHAPIKIHTADTEDLEEPFAHFKQFAPSLYADAMESMRESTTDWAAEFKARQEEAEEAFLNMSGNISRSLNLPTLDIGKAINTESIDKVQPEKIGRMAEYAVKLQSVFMNSGMKIYTQEYEDLQAEIDKASAKLEKLNAAVARGEATNPKFTGTTTYREMQYDIEAAETEIRRLEDEQDKLELSGNATQWNFSGAVNGLSDLKKRLQGMFGIMAEFKDKLLSIGKAYATVVSGMGQLAFNPFGTSIKAISALKNKITSLIPLMGSAKKSTNGFSLSNIGLANSLLRTTKMLKLMVVRMALRGVIDGVKTGFQNLAQYSTEVDANLSLLMNTLNQLKNSFAAAFAPLLNVVTPIINSFLQVVINAVNTINQLISALTGQSTWIKATAQTDDYADSLTSANAAAKKLYSTTLGIDELNINSGDDTSSGSGGSGASTGTSSMFETVPLDFEFTGWENLGSTLASNLADWLEGIDWASIKAKAETLGRNFAQILNGVFANMRLAEDIGRTIGEALNTVVNFVYGFVDELKWQQMGRWFGTMVQTALTTFDFAKLGDTIGKLVNGIADSIIGFFQTYDVGTLGSGIASMIQKAIDTIEPKKIGTAISLVMSAAFQELTALISGIDFSELGSKVSTMITTAVTTRLNGQTVTQSIGTALATAINAVSDFLLTATECFDSVGKAIADGINKFIQKIDAKKMGKAIGQVVKKSLSLVSTLLKNTDFEAIGDKIGEFLVGLDFTGILIEFAKVVWEAIKAGFSLLPSVFDAAPLETTLLTAFALLNFGNIGSFIGRGIVGTIGSALGIAFSEDTSILSTLNTCLSKLTGGIDFSSIAVGVAAVAGEFLAVSDAVSDITLGTGNLAASLAELVIGAGAASAALYAAFGPAGLVVAALTGCAAAISGINGALDEQKQAMIEQSEIEKYGSTVSDLTTNIKEGTQAIKDRLEASKDYVDNAGNAEAAMALDLSGKYFDLAEKENLTNEQKAEMQRLAGLLVDTYPDLKQYYDDETQLLNTSREAVEEKIKAKLEEIKLQAYEEKLVETYQAQADQIKYLRDLYPAAKDAQEELNEATQKYADLQSDLELAQEYEDTKEAILNCVGSTDELLEKQESLRAKLEDKGWIADNAVVDIGLQLGEVGEEVDRLKEKFGEIQGTIKEALSSNEEIQSSIDSLESTITSGMEGVAENAIAGFNKGINDNASDTEDSIATWTNEYVISVMEGFLDEHSPSKVAEEKGEYFVEGFNQGISENMSSTTTVIEEWVAGITEAFNIDTITEAITAFMTGFQTKWAEFTAWWNGTAIPAWWENDVKPWFSQETWFEMTDGMKTGTINKWDAFVTQWKTSIQTWWNNNVKPWFTRDKWFTVTDGMKTGTMDKWNEFVGEWEESTAKWWKDDVEPWFEKAKWEAFGTNMKDGIYTGFEGIVKSIAGILNKLEDVFEDAMNDIVDAVNDFIKDYNKAASVMGTSTLSKFDDFRFDGIKGYAVGGYPEEASLFWAGENGIPEIVGTVGGRTAVASGAEITGIRQEVQSLKESNAALQNTVISLLQVIAEKDTSLNIDGRELVKAYDTRKARNGYPFT